MEFASLIVIGLVVLTTAYLHYYIQRLYLYKQVAKVPGPPTLPIIGNAQIFFGSSEDIFNKCIHLAKNYPSPFRFWLAHRLFYVIYDPERIKTVLLSPNTIEKEMLHKFWEPWVGTGLSTASGSKWKIHRKFIMPTLKPSILESFVKVFSAQSEILVKQMEVEMNGQEFDIFRYISFCTLDIMCETSISISLNTQSQRASPYIDAASKISEIIYNRAFKVWLYPDFIFNTTKQGKDTNECIRYLHKVTEDVILEKRENLKMNDTNEDTANITSSSVEEKRKDYLDMLLEPASANLTNDELRQEVDTLILSGYEAIATEICFVMLVLASNPEIQDKVYEELYKIYGNADPCTTPVKYEDLPQMQYLERVIKETMRLFPVTAMIYRRVTDDLDIGDYTMVKGSSVALGIFKTHRSEKYWKDPLTFDPDRFLPEECAKRHPYSYIPFSAGPRNCLGVRYAMMSMKTILATVLLKYVIKKDNIVPLQDVKVKSEITLKPVEPITIRLEKRMRR